MLSRSAESRIGAGISGNKVHDLQKRLDRDVIEKRPTLVVIYIGINDVWHSEMKPPRGTSKDDFTAGLKDIIGKIKAAGARVVLCTPTVIGEKKTNKLDAQLDEYADMSRKVAAETGVPHLYFTGCAGNLAAGKYNDGSPDNRPVLAERLYRAMVASEERMERVEAGRLVGRSRG